MIKSVAGIIFINNKYLFQVRDNKSNIWFPGFNGFFGGLVDKNEIPYHAIKREILEELNIPVVKVKLLIKVNFQPSKLKQQRERFYYLITLKKNFEKQLKINEGSDFKFLSINQLKLSKMIPWDITAIYYHQLILTKKRFIPN